jgi:hypothetical protein
MGKPQAGYSDDIQESFVRKVWLPNYKGGISGWKKPPCCAGDLPFVRLGSGGLRHERTSQAIWKEGFCFSRKMGEAVLGGSGIVWDKTRF